MGGARSGKSSEALKIAEEVFLKDPGPNPGGLFIATAQALDREMELRIDAHRKQRGEKWVTLEEPVRLCRALGEADKRFQVILIDCLTMWLSNVLISGSEDPLLEINRLADALKKTIIPTIMVSNEVGMGLVPENSLGRRFRDLQGILNQEIASLCCTVIFMAAGLPLALKGTIPDPGSC